MTSEIFSKIFRGMYFSLFYTIGIFFFAVFFFAMCFSPLLMSTFFLSLIFIRSFFFALFTFALFSFAHFDAIRELMYTYVVVIVSMYSCVALSCRYPYAYCSLYYEFIQALIFTRTFIN